MVGTKRTNRGRRRVGALAVLGALGLLAVGVQARAAAEPGRIERIELKGEGSSTKVIVMLSRPIAFNVHVLEGDPARKSARRLVLDFDNATLAPEATKPIDVASDLLRQIRPGQFKATTARIVLDLASDTAHSVDAFETPPHVTIALAGATTGGTPAAPAKASVEAPAPTGAEAAEAPPTEASKTTKPAKTIPIKARWRKPYSLMYSR